MQPKSPFVPNRVLLLLNMALVMVFLSCSDNSLPELYLPSEEIILARGSVALVTREYARVYEFPIATAPVLAPVRRGDFGLIRGADTGQSVVNRVLDYWYEVEFEFSTGKIRGWIFGSDIELHTTQARAQSAALELLESR